jgi:retron-type reverse transcriptase
VASSIASFCEKNETFHRGHFGYRQKRSTSDAVAQLVAKVEKAWNEQRIALPLLLDVKGAFDKVNKRQLLKRMVRVGVADNIVRLVDSFLSDQRAMLVIDGKTEESRSIQAGLPQRSPVTPVLFILYVSVMFQWLEDRHLMLQTIPFVDDIGLVIECCELGDCTRQLERIARDPIRCWSENKSSSRSARPRFLCLASAVRSSRQRKMQSSALASRLSRSTKARPSGSTFGSIRSYLQTR